MKKRIESDFHNYYNIIKMYITRNDIYFFENFAFEAISIENNEKRLINILEKTKTYLGQKIYKWEEIEFFENMKKFLRINENFIKIYEYFENKKEFVIIMDYYENIDIKSFNIEDIRKLLIQLNQTFKIMVSNKIPIRCFKIENIIKYQNKYLFNYIESIRLNQGLIRNFVSNHAYSFKNADFIAPELKNKMIMNPNSIEEYNIYDKCGLWSLGILIYTLIYKTKLLNKNYFDDYDNILENQQKTGNKDLDDLMQQLLNIEPDKRITWDKYFSHPFFKNN